MTNLRNLITKAALARAAGIGATSVGKHCKRVLAPAVYAGKVDVAHPAASAWLLERNVNPTNLEPLDPNKPVGKNGGRPKAPRKTGIVAPGRPAVMEQIPVTVPSQNDRGQKPKHPDDRSVVVQTANGEEQLVNLFDMTLREIVDRFGSTPGFREFLEMEKKVEEIKEKRLKNQRARGELIDRSLVSRHIFAHLEASHNRLLNDSPQTIANRVIDAYIADEAREVIIEMVRDLISDQIKGLKHKAREALKNADSDD